MITNLRAIRSGLSVIGEPIDGSKWSGSMVSMKYIEPPTDDPDHDEFCDRSNFHDNQYFGNPIGILHDFNSGREIIVEFDGRSLDDLLKSDRPKTRGKIKRGVADKSFREVSPSGELEPNLAYTIKQAAEFLQLSEETVLKLCRANKYEKRLESSQHENAYRIRGSILFDYLKGP